MDTCLYKMKCVVAYVRSLLGWCEENPAIETNFKPSFKHRKRKYCFKRDRVYDEYSSDEDSPALKRLKQRKRTSYPDHIASNSNNHWNKEAKQSNNVRYVPIQVEPAYPSTSTPYGVSGKARGKAVPTKLMGLTANGALTPARKPRMRRRTPLWSVVYAVPDDDGPEVTWVKNKPENSRKQSKVYINLDEYENDDHEDSRDDDPVQYYRPRRKFTNRYSDSPRKPKEITKTDKKAPTPVARWMQPQKSSNLSQMRNRFINLIGSARSTLSDVFNLDAKRNYQDLITRFTGAGNPVSVTKPVEVLPISMVETINLADDSKSFRMTQRTQKQVLNEIRLVEKGLLAETERDTTKEYVPLTVASKNSSDSEIEILPSDSSSVRIDPVNTLKHSYRDRAATNNDWLIKLDYKLRKQRLDTQKKFRNARHESDIISKVNYEQKFTGAGNTVSVTKSVEVLPISMAETANLADDSTSFRMKQRTQKQALNEIRLVEKERGATKEYGPLTVALINSSDSEIEILPSESSPSSVRIDPVNSIQDSYRDRGATDNDWLIKLDYKFRKQKQDMQKKLRDARHESDIISKVNYERKFTSAGNPLSVTNPVEVLPISMVDTNINLADDSKSLRMTQTTQKQVLDEIRLVEKGIFAEKERETTKEFDPQTIASINSSDSEIEIVPSESSSSSSEGIDPIKTLKDSLAPYRNRAATNNDWLIQLNSREKRQDTQEKFIISKGSKVNYEQKLAHLEHQLKHELSIPESLIEEPQPTVALPKLTPEQEKLISRAIGPGPPGQLLVEKFNLRIHRRDLQTLAGLNWLNDEVINFYMNLLMQRSEEKKDLPKVYATNTFFYPKLMQSGQAGLRQWTRKVDIFSHDLMVVPVHLSVHWCLSLVDFREKRVSYLDSMGGRNQPCLDALLQYLRDEHKDKKGQPLDDKEWKTECLSKDIPQQMNGSDCGMFACTFAEFSCRGAPYTFTQSHMPYLRRKAALEILQGRLLL